MQKETRRRVVFIACLGAALLVGAWHAWSHSFVTDDAFISFRYAKHLVEGKGLVYNVGERVEGYTNFLWTMIMAGGLAAGIDPVPLSTILGICFHLLTIALSGWLVWRLFSPRESGRGAPWWSLLPLSALALAVHRDFNVYATSGLETAAFTFSVLLLFTQLVLAESGWSFVRAGVVGAMMLFLRPDGIVFLVAALAYVVLLRQGSARRMLLFLAPLLLLYAPYWLWRYSYYGLPFPNTFYAKSIDLPNYENGFAYLWLYFKTYYAIPVGFVLAALFAGRALIDEWREKIPRIAAGGLGRESYATRALAASLLFIGAWLAFIVRIGGDFMFARFLIPVTPLLFLLVEQLVLAVRAQARVLLVAAVVVAALLRLDQFTEERIVGNIADECQFYTWEGHAWNKARGQTLRRYFDDAPLRVAFAGTQAQVVYYADPDLAIEFETGLTDSFVAHQELKVRGRPGHEKKAPREYLLKRNVNFMLWGNEPASPEKYVSSANFSGITMPILVYDDAIMRRFANDPSVMYADVPAILDAMIASFPQYTDEDIVIAYRLLSECYFRGDADPVRRAAMLRELRRRSLPIPGESPGS